MIFDNDIRIYQRQNLFCFLVDRLMMLIFTKIIESKENMMSSSLELEIFSDYV